jgi:hypothetical protein
MIGNYDDHGNLRNPSKHVTPKSSLDRGEHVGPPEGEWMCLDCQTVKDHTLMATWVPDMLTTEGLPTGSCKGCYE